MLTLLWQYLSHWHDHWHFFFSIQGWWYEVRSTLHRAPTHKHDLDNNVVIRWLFTSLDFRIAGIRRVLKWFVSMRCISARMSTSTITFLPTFSSLSFSFSSVFFTLCINQWVFSYTQKPRVGIDLRGMLPFDQQVLFYRWQSDHLFVSSIQMYNSDYPSWWRT